MSRLFLFEAGININGVGFVRDGMRIGYACINNTLAEEKICVNRSMVKRTFLEKGVSYASELALKNVTDLEKIIDWNIANGLLMYRMSSDMFPWMSEYEIADLPDINLIEQRLSAIGRKAIQHQLRLTFHPGPFNVLATNSTSVLERTIKELRQHGEIMDLLNLPRTPFAKINIHIGGAYGDRSSALTRFIRNFSLLAPEASARLTVENDDKPNMFSVTDLLTVHEETGVPIVFDYHHHLFRSGDITTEEAMELAVQTWPSGIPPVVHFSSSRKRFEDPQSLDTAHADFIYEPINLFGHRADIMLEAKAKERATLRFLHQSKHCQASLISQ
jgi:UV DNA damage endonuclease